MALLVKGLPSKHEDPEPTLKKKNGCGSVAPMPRIE